MSAIIGITNSIEASGHGTKGTDLFRGNERPRGDSVPTDSVFVMGGAASLSPEMVSGDVAAVMYEPVQILIRNHDLSNGNAKANGIFVDLRTSTIANTIGILFDQGFPIFLGEDAQRVYRWTINMTAISLPTEILAFGDGALWFDEENNSAWIAVMSRGGIMANVKVKDFDGDDIFLKATGAGTDGDPNIPEHLDTNSASALAARLRFSVGQTKHWPELQVLAECRVKAWSHPNMVILF